MAKRHRKGSRVMKHAGRRKTSRKGKIHGGMDGFSHETRHEGRGKRKGTRGRKRHGHRGAKRRTGRR